MRCVEVIKNPFFFINTDNNICHMISKQSQSGVKMFMKRAFSEIFFGKSNIVMIELSLKLLIYCIGRLSDVCSPKTTTEIPFLIFMRLNKYVIAFKLK